VKELQSLEIGGDVVIASVFGHEVFYFDLD